jgi:hypothetical protein
MVEKAMASVGIPQTAHDTPGKILDLEREGDVFDHDPTLY